MSETRTVIREMLLAGGLLLTFALVGVGIVSLTYEKTLERIEDNRRLALQRELQALLPPLMHDNAMYEDTLQVRHATLLGSDEPLTVYRARMDDEPVAAVLTVVAPDGYSGPIRLLVAIDATDETIRGVRVVSHQETPGLGDAIEHRRGAWITRFRGHGLDEPTREGWRVRVDGGSFDQITGATVTARAVVRAVRNALLYFRNNRETLFTQTDDFRIPEPVADKVADKPPAESEEEP